MSIASFPTAIPTLLMPVREQLAPEIDIVVFDAEFVEQNVYSGQEVRPEQRQALLEFALGDQAVKLQKQIGDLTKKISAETAKRGGLFGWLKRG